MRTRSAKRHAYAAHVRRRVDLARSCLEDSAIRIHVPSAGRMADADILRTWLRNGSVGLYAADIDVVLTALEDPINEPVDPLAKPQDLIQRRAAIEGTRVQLLQVKASRIPP